MIEIGRRRAVVPLALFFGTFAWCFAYVSLPFYIQRPSGGDTAATLRWTGWILGVTPLVTVVMAPVWGRVAGHRNPKLFSVAAQSLQGLAFFGIALARTPFELLAARFALGVVGASSTFAFIMAGRAASADDVRRQVASIQPPAAPYVVLALLGLLCVPCAGGLGRRALA